MREEKKLRILFIGNSHTYFNDMPNMVAAWAKKGGYDCEVTMIAHGGWYLAQHVEEPDVRFNIKYGHYDYVILQEHAHPFGPEEKFFEAVRILNEWIREAGSIPVIYGVWAKKEEPEKQKGMDKCHFRIADEIGALLAPVAESWRLYRERRPDVELYYEDGAHASHAGSELAAECIWETIQNSIKSDLKIV